VLYDVADGCGVPVAAFVPPAQGAGDERLRRAAPTCGAPVGGPHFGVDPVVSYWAGVPRGSLVTSPGSSVM